MVPEQLAQEARDAISGFCLTECPAYCCRKGSISLTTDELTLLTGPETERMLSKQIIVKSGADRYSLQLSYEKGCPMLLDYKCTIHDNPDRPLVCREFPIFITGKHVHLASSCFAVKTNILFPYIRQFRESGYDVSE